MVGSGNRRKFIALVAGGLACLAGAAAPAQEAAAERANFTPDDVPPPLVYPIGPHADRALFAQAGRSAGRSTFAPAPRRKPGFREIGPDYATLSWGFGTSVTRPTAPDDPLDAGTWSAGLASVAFAVHGARLYGVLPSYRCALAGDVDRGQAYGLVIQPFLNYNLPDGWYLMSVPVISADWLAPGSQRWTVPMGGGIGRFARVGTMPLSVQAGYYYNVEKPDGAPDWTVRLELRLAFSG